MTLQKMSAQELAQQLPSLQLWHFDAKLGSITREFVLSDFLSAFEFMKRIAIEAENREEPIPEPEPKKFKNIFSKNQN